MHRMPLIIRQHIPTKGKGAVLMKGQLPQWEWSVFLYENGREIDHYGVKTSEDGFDSIVCYFKDMGIKSKLVMRAGDYVRIYRSNLD